MSADLTIKFPNEKLREDFATWLCEQGEQDYFNWAEIQDVQVSRFQYHEEKVKNGKTSYGKFLADNVVIVHE